MSTSPRRPPSWEPLAEALLGRAEFTPGEVARIAGVSIEHARRLWQGLGFPPVADEERVFTRVDAEILRAVHELSETQGAVPADQLTLTRVIGQAMERVADAQVSIAAARLNWLDSSRSRRSRRRSLGGLTNLTAPRRGCQLAPLDDLPRWSRTSLRFHCLRH